MMMVMLVVLLVDGFGNDSDNCECYWALLIVAGEGDVDYYGDNEDDANGIVDSKVMVMVWYWW